MLVPERQPCQPQKRENFQAIAVVVGDPEQRRVRIEREHSNSPRVRGSTSLTGEAGTSQSQKLTISRDDHEPVQNRAAAATNLRAAI